MSSRTVKLLHVEDDAFQRKVIGHYLGGLKDVSFSTTFAATEDEALKEFGSGGAELVILDYMLTQGNGLSCLQRLRQLDGLVPIIALSGAATPETAAELLQAGADDFLAKQGLKQETLAQSVRDALSRAEGVQKRTQVPDAEQAAHVNRAFRDICSKFSANLGAEFLQQLEDFEASARRTNLTAGQLQRLFDTFCADLDSHKKADSPRAKAILRPLMLEVALRLFGHT